MKQLSYLLIILFLTSCSISNRSIRTPNYMLNFDKKDFTYSEQIVGEAVSVRVLGVDWKRLFKWSTATNGTDLYTFSSDQRSFGSVGLGGAGSINVNPSSSSFYNIAVPIIGNIQKGKVSSYALSNLIGTNPGWDVVFYPQYHLEKKGLPFLYSRTTVKVQARMGRLNP